MYGSEPITVQRDVDAILIPAGTPITLREGSIVFVTQALGGNYTVNINGNLAQVSAMNADALGFEAQESPLTGRETATADGEVDETQVWDMLRTCYDPEIPINMVDLGLIYDCTITPLEDGGNRVDILMTLTAPGCGMGDFLAEDVRQKVAMVPNVTQVNVELTFDPPWNADMMTEAARLETGLL